MSLLPPSSAKHDLSGIGAASAAVIMAILATNPSTVFLTVGIPGKIVFWILEKIFTRLASSGLVILNVGAEKISVVIDKVKFDGSIESAEKLIAEIRKTGRELTPEEIKAIDDDVIIVFRKFAKIGRRANENKT